MSDQNDLIPRSVQNLPVRALEMIGTLSNQHQRQMATSDLAESLSVDARTIRRYVSILQIFLEQHGHLFPFPRPELTQIEGRSAVRLTDVGSHINQAQLEEVAAAIAIQSLSTIEPQVLGHNASEWMQRQLNNSAQEWFRHVRSAFVYRPFGAKRYANAQADVFRNVLSATLGCRELHIGYVGLDGRSRDKDIQPLTIVLYRDGFYLIARECKSPRRMRILAIDRISTIEQQQRTFERPSEFNPNRYLNGDFGLWRSDQDRPQDVQILFTPEAARVAQERAWPGQSRWEDEADGTSILRLHVTITPEFMAWILSWGCEATVLSPASLRNQMIQSLQASLEKYR